MKSNNNKILTAIEKMALDLEGVKLGLNEVKLDLEAVKGGLSEVKLDLNEVKKDLEGVKLDVKGVKEDIKKLPTKEYVKKYVDEAVDRGIKATAVIAEGLRHDFKAATEGIHHLFVKSAEHDRRLDALDQKI